MQPSAHYLRELRKHIPEAEWPVGGFSIRRRVSTDVGFLGSRALRDLLGSGREAIYSHADNGLTIIDRECADRLAATFPGTQTQLDRAFEDAFRTMTQIHVSSAHNVELVPPDDDEYDDYTVALVTPLMRGIRRSECLSLYTEIGTPWMATARIKAAPPHVPVYETPSFAEAQRITRGVSELVAYGRTAIVFGELYMSNPSG
jgi:hypothetical protein